MYEYKNLILEWISNPTLIVDYKYFDIDELLFK